MGGTGRRGPYGGKWHAIRKRVLERDNHQCQIGLPLICNGTANTADHITPIAWGGAWWDMANLRAACTPCNQHLGRIARNHTPRAEQARENVGKGSRHIPQMRASRDW